MIYIMKDAISLTRNSDEVSVFWLTTTWHSTNGREDIGVRTAAIHKGRSGAEPDERTLTEPALGRCIGTAVKRT